MDRQGFYFDQRRCIGCRTCQVACKDKNRLEVGTLFRSVASYQTGVFPDATTYHYASTCNHCLNPECVAVCPAGAMYVNEEDGTIQHNDDLCIGCQYCTTACPYGAPKYVEAAGIVKKCDGCIGLRAKGEQPACVAACVMRALEFGPIDELRAAHPDAVDQIAILPEPLTTPSLCVSARQDALDPDYQSIIV